MLLQYSIYSLVLILLILFSLVIITYIYLLDIFRKKNHIKFESFIVIGSVIWMMGNLFEIEASSLDIKLLGSVMTYAGLAIIGMFWIAFAIDYVSLKKWFTRVNIILLGFFPLILIGLASTNDFHRLFFDGVELVPYMNFTGMVKEYNAMHWIALGYLLASILLGSFIVGRMLVISIYSYRWQATLFVLALVIPVSVIIISLFDLDVLPFLDTIPISIAVSSIVMSIILSRSRSLEIIPIAVDNVVDSISDGIIVLDNHDNILDFNYTVERIFGKNIRQAAGNSLADFSRDLDLKYKHMRGDDRKLTEFTVEDDNGRSVYDIGLSPIYNWQDIFVGRTILLRDITERKQREAEIRYLSFNDKLTKLFNRAYFESELVRLDQERQLPISIIIGDINGLKLVNDAFGYREGDRLLKDSANILKDSVRSEDIVARWGGDEFIILLPQSTGEKADSVIERIQENFRKASGSRIPMSISLGSFTKTDMRQNINNVIREAEERMQRRKLLEGKSVYNHVLSSLKKTLQEKSHETQAHAERIKELAIKMGEEVGLPRNKLDELELLAALHDIGKIAIPNELLEKEKELLRKEWSRVRRHSEIGYRIALSTPQISKIADAILYHHEWWNGKGYPQGIKGEEIPITARIIAIIDAYDVMRNGRSYKEKMPPSDILAELKKKSGSQFDPRLIRKFLSLMQDNLLLLDQSTNQSL